MAEYKSHRVLVKNIPKEKPLCSVGNKSMAGLLIGLFLIVLVAYYFQNIYIVIPLLLYQLFLVCKPYCAIFEGYHNFFVIYDKENKNECNLYYLSELKYWCHDGSYANPIVIFFLNDNEKVVLNQVIDSEIFDYLRKVAPKKEIQKKKLK